MCFILTTSLNEEHQHPPPQIQRIGHAVCNDGAFQGYHGSALHQSLLHRGKNPDITTWGQTQKSELLVWIFAVTTELFYKKQTVVITTNLSPSSAVLWGEFTNNFKTRAVFYVSEMCAKHLYC